MDKNLWRKVAKERMRMCAETKARARAYPMMREIARVVRVTNSKSVLIFLPLKGEPNIANLPKFMKGNIKFYAPFMQNFSLKMVKLRRPFTKARFGVPQPPSSRACANVDLAVVPVLGVDKNMARIGHGKGFYDIFFDGLRTRPIVVFVSAVDLYIDDFITQSHDIQGDFYFTPTKKYFLRGKHVRDYRKYRNWLGRSGRWVSCRQKNQRRELQYLS